MRAKLPEVCKASPLSSPERHSGQARDAVGLGRNTDGKLRIAS